MIDFLQIVLPILTIGTIHLILGMAVCLFGLNLPDTIDFSKSSHVVKVLFFWPYYLCKSWWLEIKESPNPLAALTPVVVFLFAGLILILLTGCNPAAKGGDLTTQYSVKPKGFENCIVGFIDGPHNETPKLYLVRCPNSTAAAATAHKSPLRTITIDGEEYVKKDKGAE